MISLSVTDTTAEGSRRRAKDRVDSELSRWRGALTVAGWAALASVALTFLQVWIYVQWPPPETVGGFFALFADNPLLGLLSLDLRSGPRHVPGGPGADRQIGRVGS